MSIRHTIPQKRPETNKAIQNVEKLNSQRQGGNGMIEKPFHLEKLQKGHIDHYHTRATPGPNTRTRVFELPRSPRIVPTLDGFPNGTGESEMLDEYKKLETFIIELDGDFTESDARSALPKLVAALLGDEVAATGGEITAICEFLLQVTFNGFAEMTPETRKRFLPVREMRRQNSRLRASC
jgi:hypothetical protein